MRPCDIIDLSHFSLTGPKNASAIIPASTLVNAFTDEDFFFVRAQDNETAVIFKTPKSGSTTANSTKPRSELREQLFPPSNDRNWALAGKHSLSARCAVYEVKDKVYIAQIHGKKWNHPVMKLAYVAKDKMLVLDVKQGPDGEDKHIKLLKMPLKRFFRYEVAVRDGMLDVTVGATVKSVDLLKLGFKQNDADWYFKAGCYGPSSEVAFTELERGHS